MVTKQLLGEEYKFEPGNGQKSNSYLAKFGIETYLVETNSEDDVKRIKFRLERIG
jgi:hypothetical protein